MRLFMMLFAAAAPAAAQNSSLLPAGPATPSLARTAPAATVPVPVAAPAPMAAIAPVAPTAMLRMGTEVELRTAEYLTTEHKDLRVGQRVRLEVASNVMANSRVVIPAGAPAMAEITDVRNKGGWGKSGHFNARVLYVRVGDRDVRLTGSFDDHGTTGTAGVVAAIALVPIAGFLTTGTSAKMPIGTSVKAFLDEDLQLL